MSRLGTAAVAAGSIGALGLTAHTAYNLTQLRRPALHPPAVAERVSVLIPARDEAQHNAAARVKAEAEAERLNAALRGATNGSGHHLTRAVAVLRVVCQFLGGPCATLFKRAPNGIWIELVELLGNVRLSDKRSNIVVTHFDLFVICKCSKLNLQQNEKNFKTKKSFKFNFSIISG